MSTLLQKFKCLNDNQTTCLSSNNGADNFLYKQAKSCLCLWESSFLFSSLSCRSRGCQSGRKFFCLSLKIQCIKLLVIAIAHSQWKKLYQECTSIKWHIQLNSNDEGAQVMALTNWIKCRNPTRSNRTSTRQHDFSWALYWSIFTWACSLISSLSIVVEFLTMIIILINIIGRFFGRNKSKNQ